MKRSFALIGAAAALSVTLGGCHRPDSTVSWEPNGMPSHVHPHQEWWSYQFVYHPRAQVYYEPYTQTYFWFADGMWEQGPEVPANIPLDARSANVVKLQQPAPYVQHASVVAWNWPWFKAVPGSLNEEHMTASAIMTSQQRGAERMAAYAQKHDLVSDDSATANANANDEQDGVNEDFITHVEPGQNQPE